MTNRRAVVLRSHIRKEHLILTRSLKGVPDSESLLSTAWASTLDLLGLLSSMAGQLGASGHRRCEPSGEDVEVTGRSGYH